MSDKPRVLLIDDSEIAVEVTRAVLERDGFDVRAATSLGEFNVILKTWSPTIVLTDVNMPGVTGPDLCRWIKVRMDTQSVPVVLFSELPDESLAELAKSAGADGFLSKSNGVDSLSHALTALCEEIVW
jgi:twitching motility two-component system response regulator PilH